MASSRVSTKRILIDRANSTIVIAVGIAAFITVFSLVASRSLLARRSYQAKVIGVQEKSRDQLKKNIEAVSSLKSSYQGFVSRTENMIGGSSTGTGERDGDNAKLALDALPSKYDFPALAASLEKVLQDRGYVIQSISGVDDEATQNPSSLPQEEVTPTTASGTTAVPAGQEDNKDEGDGAVLMPFEVTAKGSYVSLIELISTYQHSIRPLHVLKLNFKANNDGSVSLKTSGQSYYQPEKSLNITEEVVQ